MESPYGKNCIQPHCQCALSETVPLDCPDVQLLAKYTGVYQHKDSMT